MTTVRIKRVASLPGGKKDPPLPFDRGTGKMVSPPHRLSGLLRSCPGPARPKDLAAPRRAEVGSEVPTVEPFKVLLGTGRFRSPMRKGTDFCTDSWSASGQTRLWPLLKK